jgi:hypothetical protein
MNICLWLIFSHAAILNKISHFWADINLSSFEILFACVSFHTCRGNGADDDAASQDGAQ